MALHNLAGGKQALAGVLHGEQGTAGLLAQGHGDGAAAGREFAGVGEQVIEHAGKLAGVQVGLEGLGRGLEGKGSPALLSGEAVYGQLLGHEGVKVDRLFRQVAAVGFVQRQHVAQQGRGFGTGPADELQWPLGKVKAHNRARALLAELLQGSQERL